MAGPARPAIAPALVKFGTRTSSAPRLAAANEPNRPAATPEEDEAEKLEVPLTPDPDPRPEPALPPEDEDEPVVVPPVVDPAPAPRTPTLDEPTLSPANAEGREIAQVRVVGNRVVNAEPILLAASTTRPGAAYSARQVELDRRRIRELGFFAAVDHQVVPNLQNPEKVDVIFVVVENRVVSGFRFEGNREVEADELEEVVTSPVGAVLNSTRIDEDVKRIQALYSERGYASLVTDVRQDDDGTVIFVIQEGVISRIELVGLSKTRPSIVRSVIATEPGDPFNEQTIQRDLNRIYDLGFFEDVSYKVADDPETPGALIVTISLKERRTGQISVGVGFDSRSKISGFAGVSDSNFRGTGKNISAQVELGAQRSFELGFGDRFVGSRNASYSINVFDRRTYREPRAAYVGGGSNTDQFTYEEQRRGVRFNFTQPLDFDRSRNVLFGYRNEDVNLFLTDRDGSQPVELPSDATGRISAFSVGFMRDKRDLRIDPSRGSRELFLVEQGVGFLGGSSTFTKADVDLRRYIPLMGPQEQGQLPRMVLAGRVVFGRSFGNLPAFEQYFIGGSETVRGYDADEQYGDNQVFGNVELRYRFQRKFQFVAFADAGTAFGGQFTSSEAADTLIGVGIGVRLQTPIGPVRLDIARGRDGVKTHFGIGSTF